MRPVSGPACHCATCGDEAVAMRVLRGDGERALALCEDPEGTRRAVDITLIGECPPGSTVLVHAGVAIALAAAGPEGAAR